MKNLVLATAALSIIVFYPTEDIAYVDYQPEPVAYKIKYDGLDPYTWCKRDKDCQMITEAVYHEARGEGPEGMQSVASVILNRSLLHDKPPYDIIKSPYQFSYIHQVKDKTMYEKKPMKLAYQIAYQAVHGALVDITNGATHYYSTKVMRRPPYWAKHFEYVADINNHRFYR